MKACFALLAVALAAMGFGWWGINTVAGRAVFDEMAGMIPLAIGGAGALLGIVALVLIVRLPRR